MVDSENTVAISTPRDPTALAAVNAVTGATRYDLPKPVSVPDNSAAMVLLMAQPVRGEAVYLYAPDPGAVESSKHPFRVVRFRNDTKALLERGPIAVFESAAFLGQGVLEPLSAGAEATVPFALDRAIALDVQRKQDTRDSRVARIENGNLTVERDSVLHTTYRIQNGTPKEAKLLIRHPRTASMKLKNAPEGTVDDVGEGRAMVPSMAPASKSIKVEVDERQPIQTGLDWMSPEADTAVKAYLADWRANADAVRQLTKAWDIRRTLELKTQERAKLRGQQQVLNQSTAQARESLKALGKTRGSADLLKRLGDRLDDMERQLLDVNKQIMELELSIQDQQTAFQKLVREIHVTDPLPDA
jgi:hypothetical protein